VSLRDVGDERQPEARARDGLVFRNLGAIEGLENPLVFVRLHADAVIGDADDGAPVIRHELELDVAPRARVLHGVGEQIQDGLLNRIPVHRDRREAIVNRQAQGEPLRFQRVLHGTDRRAHRLGERHALQPIALLAAIDAREIEDIVEQTCQPLAFVDDRVEVLLGHAGILPVLHLQRLGEHPDRRQWRLELV
jgi:hypothetical protein